MCFNPARQNSDASCASRMASLSDLPESRQSKTVLTMNVLACAAMLPEMFSGLLTNGLHSSKKASVFSFSVSAMLSGSCSYEVQPLAFSSRLNASASSAVVASLVSSVVLGLHEANAPAPSVPAVTAAAPCTNFLRVMVGSSLNRLAMNPPGVFRCGVVPCFGPTIWYERGTDRSSAEMTTFSCGVVQNEQLF